MLTKYENLLQLSKEQYTYTEQMIAAINDSNLSKDDLIGEWLLWNKRATIFANEIQKIKETDSIVEKELSKISENHKNLKIEMQEWLGIPEYDN